MEQQKQNIRKAFSRAASTYDAYADVQHESAERLAGHFKNACPKTILEIGCATGNYTSILADRFPSSHITSIDFSEAMIEVASSKLSGRKNLNLICADAEDFLKNAKPFDLITSNATFQWFSNPEIIFKDASRLLHGHGLLLFSVFGPETFKELGMALSHAYGRHVSLPAHNFTGKDKMLASLAESYSSVKAGELILSRKYPSTIHLLKHIKNTGTTGRRLDSTSGYSLRPLILTKSRIRAMDEWFIKNHGECKTTYQLFIIEAYK